MKISIKNPFVLMLLSIWLGVFVTVSFLETPFKFQVPGITLAFALELGKIMFGLSTKIQFVLLILVLTVMIVNRMHFTKVDFTFIFLLSVILIAEKFWMLPVLDTRADFLSAGKPVAPSNLHDYFIYAESAKLIILLTAIIFQFKSKNTLH